MKCNIVMGWFLNYEIWWKFMNYIIILYLCLFFDSDNSVMGIYDVLVLGNVYWSIYE